MLKQSPHAIRKNEHIEHALYQHSECSTTEFQQTRFIHNAIPETNFNNIDITTSIEHLKLDTPFFINAMTGGNEQTKAINKQLAIIAKETKIALATGSCSIMITEPNSIQSFKIIKEENPSGIVFANIGAHHTVENAKKVIDILQADALQIHVNAPQEMAMKEGDRNFKGWLHNIEEIIKNCDVPIIVKEVGFGMTKETIHQLLTIGVKTIDISGRGGTNFAKIETARYQNSPTFLNDWGLTTIESLLEAKFVKKTNPFNLIASGGIKNADDITKCLILGANLVGLSTTILYQLQHYGIEHTIEFINQTKQNIKTIMTLLGAYTIPELQQKELLLPQSLVDYKKQRNLL